MFYADSYCAIDGRGEGKDKICFKEGEEVPLGGEVFLLSIFLFLFFIGHLGGEGGEEEAVEGETAEVGDGQGDQAENRLN